MVQTLSDPGGRAENRMRRRHQERRTLATHFRINFRAGLPRLIAILGLIAVALLWFASSESNALAAPAVPAPTSARTTNKTTTMPPG